MTGNLSSFQAAENKRENAGKGVVGTRASGVVWGGTNAAKDGMFPLLLHKQL